MIITRDQAFGVVFNIRTPISTGGESVGTGIFVVKNDDEIYLVTATHVASACDFNTVVVISDASGNATTLRLADFNNELVWRHHPVADISALPIQMSPIIQPHLTNRFFPFDHFHIDHTPVSRDYELTSVGFPNGLGANGMFSPLTYRSYASSSFISLNRADTQTPSEFFLLENPSVGGYSGCPVFDLGYMVVGAMTTTKDKTRCYGIMHGTISDNTGGKLAAVTPSFYLAELI
jgi:Trypsin-like peptidase domain